jgi:hypothetical protein
MALISQSYVPYSCHDMNIQNKLQRYHAGKLTTRSYNGMGLELKELKIQQPQGQLSYGGGKRQNNLYQNYMHKGRGNLLVVAASPPTEDVAVMSEPLTKEDLVAYLASGCKPKEKWRYGILIPFVHKRPQCIVAIKMI